MTSKDKRRFERKSVGVEITGDDGQGIGALVFDSSDLSSGGAFLRSDLLLEVNDRLTLAFTIPGTDRTLRATARIAWVRAFPREDEPAGMGVEFLAMTPEDQAALREHLASDAPTDP